MLSRLLYEKSPPSLQLMFGIAMVMMAGTIALTACGDEEPSGCTTNTDCAEGQFCADGTCVDRATRDGGLDESADTDMSSDGEVGPDVVPDLIEDADVVPDTSEDLATTTPRVIATDPANGERSVALDASVVITFNQPMRDTSLTASNVTIESYLDEDMVRSIVYDRAEHTVTLTPIDISENFLPVSPYTVTVGPWVRGENNIPMGSDFQFSFYTSSFDNAAEHEVLAQAYAPVIYQEVRPGTARNRTNRIDWFTSIDFDGDLDASNNLENGGNGSSPLLPHVYYNVLETETHYLIQYVLYYPVAVDSPDDEFTSAVEHDFAYSTVVVQKLDDDPLGRFVLAEGLGDFQVWAFAFDQYPTGCGGSGQPPCGGISDVLLDDVHVEFSPGEMEVDPDEGDDAPARRYPMYVTTGSHASCLAPVASPETTLRFENKCRHNTNSGAPFWEDNGNWGRILRFGDVATEWTDSSAESRELTYTMSPFLENFWALRDTDSMFDGNRTYTPPPSGSGVATPVPGTLNSTYDQVNPSRRAPFLAETDVAQSCGGCSRSGVWFVDPAWEVGGHYEFDHDFSALYCFNPYLGIDERGNIGCE